MIIDVLICNPDGTQKLVSKDVEPSEFQAPATDLPEAGSASQSSTAQE